jgi:hypothetical protein
LLGCCCALRKTSDSGRGPCRKERVCSSRCLLARPRSVLARATKGILGPPGRPAHCRLAHWDHQLLVGPTLVLGFLGLRSALPQSTDLSTTLRHFSSVSTAVRCEMQRLSFFRQPVTASVVKNRSYRIQQQGLVYPSFFFLFPRLGGLFRGRGICLSAGVKSRTSLIL